MNHTASPYRNAARWIATMTCLGLVLALFGGLIGQTLPDDARSALEAVDGVDELITEDAASATSTYTIVNTGGVGVRQRFEPRIASGYSGVAPEGSRITVRCQTWSEPVGRFGNRLWLQVTRSGYAQPFFIADTYTNSPRTATGPALPGIPMCTGGGSTTPVRPVATGRVDVGVPCTGTYAWGWDTDPSQHHRPFGGDVGTDWFCQPGSALRAYVNQGATMTVTAVRAACASGRIEDGGYQVKLDVTVGGQRIAWILYAHVDRPAVRVGQTISNGALLGYTAMYRQNSCYQVTSAAGVHAHIEFYNVRNYACMMDLPFSTRLTAGSRLGSIGGDLARGPAAYCPA